MVSSYLVLASLAFPSLIASASIPQHLIPKWSGKHQASTCVEPSKRRAWHTFSTAEKKEYINAELCLMSLPKRTNLTAPANLFDEIQANHQIQAEWTHFVGQFLPYHRYVMHIHEQILRNDCGYTGFQPYWDEPRDAGNFSSSIVFDAETGFGDLGRASDGCITTGPFANYTNTVGPGYLNTKHCINRKLNETEGLKAKQSEVDACNVLDDWEQANNCISGAPHAAGHVGTGGEMANPISSPGDPLFYLHHTWLDKVWYDWQHINLTSRLYAMGGSNLPTFIAFGDIEGGNASHAAPPKYMGDPGNTTTLNHTLSSLGIYPDVKVGDVMDTKGGYLCYEYVNADSDTDV